MPETNFLTPSQNNPPKNVKRPKKKAKKSAKGGSLPAGPLHRSSPPRLGAGSETSRQAPSGEKEDVSPFKPGDNITIDQPMPKAELKIKKNSSVIKKNLPGRQAGAVRNIYRKIAFSFIALTIFLVFAVLYFSFSKVTLVIIPTQEKIADSLSLTIIDKANSSAAVSGEIQGIVRQVPVEQSRTFASSGKETLGEEVSGKVTIVNSYIKNQPLVASTRLLSQSNKLYRLKNTVNVPAGGSVEAEVYADEASPDMAIGPSKFTIPGLWAGLQDKIYATSKEPMIYSEKVKHIIRQSDIDNAVNELKADLLDKAKKEISLAYQDYDQSIFEVDNNSISQEVQGKVGQEKASFIINMKTKVTVVAFKSNDVYAQVQSNLTAALADDKEIVEFIRPDTTYALANFDLSQGTASVNVISNAKVTLKNTAGIIKKNNLAGLSEAQLKAYLNSLPEISGYEIKFFPSFVRKMPNLVDRIEIVIKK